MLNYQTHRIETQARAFDMVTAWQIRKTEQDRRRGKAVRKAR